MGMTVVMMVRMITSFVRLLADAVGRGDADILLKLLDPTQVSLS